MAVYTQLLQSFQAFFSQLQMLRIYCDDLPSYNSLMIIALTFCWKYLNKVTIFRTFPLTWSVAIQRYWNKKDSTPTGLVWDTIMDAGELVWDTNMAAVTSCENTL